MRRSAALSTTLVLALVTGIVLFHAGVALTESPDDATAAAANRALVLRFYDAVNATVETGFPPLFDRLVADDFVERAVQPDAALDRAGLERYVLDLHAEVPSLRLAVDELAAQGDLVFARVSVQGIAVRTVLGFPLDDRPTIWPPVDLFRIRGGRIVEHRGVGTAPGVAQPLLRAPLTLSPDTRSNLAFARFTYQPWVTMPEMVVPGPTMFVVEAGILTVAAAQPMPMRRARDGAGGRPQMTVADASVILFPGDQIVVPAGAPYALRNDTAEAAAALGVVLVPSAAGGTAFAFEGPSGAASAIAGAPPLPLGVTIFLPSPRETREHEVPPARSEAEKGSGLSTEATAGSSSRPLGVSVQLLAYVADVTMPTGPVVLTVDRLTLAPGAGGQPVSVVGLELVIVEAGRLNSDGVQATPDVVRGFGPGGTLSVTAGTTRAIRSTGTVPLVVLVLAVTPA